MKVLHLISNLGDGGAEAVLYRLCTHDQENDHYVISMQDEGKYGPLLRNNNIPVDCLYLKRQKINLRSIIVLYQLIHNYQPDIIQTWMYHASIFGGIVGKLLNQKKIFWGIHNGDLVQEGTKKRTFFAQKLCALLSKFIPTSIIYVSKLAMNVHHKISYDKSKSIIIWNGINTKEFSPSKNKRMSFRDKVQINRETFIVGMVARYDPFKDYPNLFSSIKKLEDKGLYFTYFLVGNGSVPDNRELIESIADLSLSSKIILLGQQSDIPAVMNAIDLHLTSSKSESFGNVIAEAMSCGTPCVSTKVGAATEIIDKTGWVVASENSHQLSNAILLAYTAWQEKKSWERRKIDCRKQIIKNFSIENMISQYSKAWRS